MHKLWAVIRREFLERVRTRAFVIGTVLGPLLIGFLFALPILLERRETAPKRVVVVDGASGVFGRRVEGALKAARRGGATVARPRYLVERVPAGGRVVEARDSLLRLVGAARDSLPAIHGLLVLDDEAVESGTIPYLGTNVGSPGEMMALQQAIEPVVQAERLERAGVDPDMVRGAITAVTLETEKVTEGRLTGQSGAASFWLAYLMSFLLYVSLLLYGNQVMSSVLEEKTSRIIEVLISSLTPFQLMLGKVLGVGAVGLFQIGIWATSAMLLTTFRVPLAGLFGLPPEAVATLPIPTLSPALLAVFLSFFVLGFLVFAAAYAAIGAMCSTIQDTYQANTAISTAAAVGLISMFALLNDPSGSLARTLSLVPFLSPFVVPVRYSVAPVAPSELALSVGATAAGVVAVTWAASRIYRTGILLHGKRATLREVVRWVRAS